MSEPNEIVRIQLSQRPFGLAVTSDDVPGLYLWGRDPDVVFSDIVPAITALYLHNCQRHVTVTPVPSGTRDEELPTAYEVADEETPQEALGRLA